VEPGPGAGVNNVGPMAASPITALQALGVRAADVVTRLPAQVTTDDLERADWVVALKRAEQPLPSFRQVLGSLLFVFDKPATSPVH
jgi:hypothetical protein